MKHIYISIKIIALLTIFSVSSSCKKKEADPVEEETTVITITPGPPAHQKKMSAKVNGQDWIMTSNAWSLQLNGSNDFIFMGKTSQSSPYSMINLKLPHSIGVTDVSSPLVSMTFQSTDGTPFSAITGTINVTHFDTTGPTIMNKFKASFNFITDTINGASYIITNGEIDFEN
ncbi:MAG: hypothetical protein K0S32_801 [Bacteroidetes bacterium]|jgi:hypothetical protein|nr:hypothetical protein [Bacteroidota bacterium]